MRYIAYLIADGIVGIAQLSARVGIIQVVVACCACSVVLPKVVSRTEVVYSSWSGL